MGGASTKKKREKKKDFQKAKLKVGKTKPKPANFTDTSFKAKSIVLQKQSLALTAPSAVAQFSHHVSLLRSRSDAQRSESLAYLTSVIAGRLSGAPMPESTAVLLPKLQPLMVDGSHAVRQQLLKLFQILPTEDIARYPDNILLFTHIAMTHLSADIRNFGLEVLAWLLKAAGPEVVSCAGGWMKTLRIFVRQLGWEKDVRSNGWSNAAPSSGVKPAGERKAVLQQLLVLVSFITVGISPAIYARMADGADLDVGMFPIRNFRQHLIPERSNAYGHLHLFGAPPDEEGSAYEDRDDRQRLFVRHFKGTIEKGIAEVRKEGGELGRASAALSKAVEEGTIGYLD